MVPTVGFVTIATRSLFAAQILFQPKPGWPIKETGLFVLQSGLAIKPFPAPLSADSLHVVDELNQLAKLKYSTFRTHRALSGIILLF